MPQRRAAPFALIAALAASPALADETLLCTAKAGRELRPATSAGGTPSAAPLAKGTRLQSVDKAKVGGADWLQIALARDAPAGYALASLVECGPQALADLKRNVDGLCRVNDPSGTPMNVRDRPAGARILGSHPNGTNIRRQAGEQHVIPVNGKEWVLVYVIAYDNPLGWVRAGDVNCRMLAE